MNELNISELEEKDLHDLAEEADFVSKFFEGRMGKILKRACARTADGVDRQIAFNSDPTNVAEMTLLQTKLRFYKYEIHTLFQSIISEGEIAQQEIDLRKEEKDENYEEPTSEQGNEQDS